MSFANRFREEQSLVTQFQRTMMNAAIFIILLNSIVTSGFMTTNKRCKVFTPTRRRTESLSSIISKPLPPSTSSSTELNVFFFGGTPEVEVTTSGDSCELVEVRIERISANSRRIGGEITVEAPIDDVWAILTDYDNLSTHVPNLVESKRKRSNGGGEQGDGNYKCTLYQKGAQKIIGFEFGADVTMNMKEKTIVATNTSPLLPSERAIEFKCIDSQFFSEFDGEWKVKSSEDGLTTTLNYIVDVRPKGIVPVAALEWRIREDVPTNLRAVKSASITVGKEGVLKMRESLMLKNNRTTQFRRSIERNMKTISNSASVGSERARDLVGRVAARVNASQQSQQLTPIRVPVWDEEETMAVYLNNDN